MLTGLIFSSCQEIAIIKYSIDDAIQQAKIRKITNPYYGKDEAWSYQTNKEVLDIVKEVLKRPINKEIQFDGIKIIISENTRMNSKIGTIVDKKTGYGLQIVFNKSGYCTNPGISYMGYYSKNTENYIYELIYNKDIEGIEEIAKKNNKSKWFYKRMQIVKN